MDDDKFFIDHWNMPKRPRMEPRVLPVGWYVYRYGPGGDNIPYAHLFVQVSNPRSQMQVAMRTCDGQKFVCDNLGDNTKVKVAVRCPYCTEILERSSYAGERRAG